MGFHGIATLPISAPKCENIQFGTVGDYSWIILCTLSPVQRDAYSVN